MTIDEAVDSQRAVILARQVYRLCVATHHSMNIQFPPRLSIVIALPVGSFNIFPWPNILIQIHLHVSDDKLGLSEAHRVAGVIGLAGAGVANISDAQALASSIEGRRIAVR